jgi:predicted AAA+ superfamily ATPase
MNNNYFPRTLLDELKKWIKRREILAIKGPRQSGKTTLLLMLKEYLIQKEKINPKNIVFLTFEDRDALEKFSKSPKDYVESYIGKRKNERFYFFIDEFHYLEDGGQKLKFLYDIFDNIKFIITGSSSLELTGKTGKFLVGRMFSFYLYQFSFEEFIKAKSEQLANVYEDRKNKLRDFILNGKNFKLSEDIFKEDFKKFFEEYAIYGGYPEVIKAEDIETKKMILKNIFETYITKDIVELLRIDNTFKFKTLVTLLANQIGNLINYNSLSNDAQSYFREIKHHLSILEETFVIFLLHPYFVNKITELKKNPKVYFVDVGLRNKAVNNFNELNIRNDVGQIIENVCLSQLKMRYPDFSVKYWRTISKAEVDFILELDKEIIPIEVKYSYLDEPKIPRSLGSFIDEYKPKKVLVLTKEFVGEVKISSSIIKFIPVWYL